jgi:urocanate hydratase
MRVARCSTSSSIARRVTLSDQGLGVGVGYSQHSSVVIVCDGSEAADQCIARVLWNDPGTRIMRHADAEDEIAKVCSREQGLKLPTA